MLPVPFAHVEPVRSAYPDCIALLATRNYLQAIIRQRPLEFERWVFEEALPIATTGTDMVPVSEFLFKGAKVRVVTIDGEQWFVGSDVAKRLGYANPSNAMTDHCKGIAKRYPLQTSGGTQEFRIISEPDVLRLIVNSTLPAAQEFERWVFEEVLPTIRKTGSYVAQKSGPELVLEAIKYLEADRDRHKALAEQRAAVSSGAFGAIEWRRWASMKRGGTSAAPLVIL